MRKNKIIKKFIIGIWAGAIALSLGACGIEVPALSEEEIDKIGEYSAMLLLGNDPSRLVDIGEEQAGVEAVPEEEQGTDNTEEEQENSVEDTTDNEDGGEDKDGNSSGVEIIELAPELENDVNNVPLEAFLGLAEGVSLNYRGYEWSQSLTDQSGSYFYDAEEGKSFLIVNYNIYNASGNQQIIDFLYSGVSFIATINNDTKVSAIEMPIATDMSTYLGRVDNGSGVDLILIFECESSYIDNIISLELTLKNSEGSTANVLE